MLKLVGYCRCPGFRRTTNQTHTSFTTARLRRRTDEFAVASTSTDRDITRKQHRVLALNLAQAALAAVEAASAVRSHFRVDGDLLQVDGRQYDLNRYQNIYVVGGGKATAPMAQEVERVLGNRIRAGIVTVKYGHQLPTERI